MTEYIQPLWYGASGGAVLERTPVVVKGSVQKGVKKIMLLGGIEFKTKQDLDMYLKKLLNENPNDAMMLGDELAVLKDVIPYDPKYPKSQSSSKLRHITVSQKKDQWNRYYGDKFFKVMFEKDRSTAFFCNGSDCVEPRFHQPPLF